MSPDPAGTCFMFSLGTTKLYPPSSLAFLASVAFTLCVKKYCIYFSKRTSLLYLHSAGSLASSVPRLWASLELKW